ncbi:MAG: glucans biosynthesis glucosyltransferase MdoH [Thermodesulfobacteriota bacterium]
MNQPWSKAAKWRRRLLLVLILAPTLLASRYMMWVLPHHGVTWLEAAIVLVFAILFAWISLGFWTATLGFLILAGRYDHLAITKPRSGKLADIKPDTRTAILFPICNEEVNRVMAGLKATYLSLDRTGRLDRFDFFILSDTQDPDRWVEEEAAWTDLNQELQAFGRIHYRRRRVNLKRKSGNVADFCRRFGQNYKYMIVFDADSVMTGPTLVRMVRIMERRSDVGLLQTLPAGVNRETPLARVQQFASGVYGPMFAAGLNFWLLGDMQYWGHNAIIRVAPFMRHCGLGRLPGHPPLGGDIMSHDFVEAALMRKAGYGVWLAYDLGGSFEEMPPTLLEELKRDRRWCQGNLQHLRLILAKGFSPIQRALFLNGAMSYGSALLWLIFLLLSTAEALVFALTPPTYFPATKVLFPSWPVWYPEWAVTLLASTVLLLFLPKFFCLFLITVLQGRAGRFGGAWKLLAGILTEIIVSSLLAPIRMIFHSKFVFLTLLGQQVGWGAQRRDDSGTSWSEAWRFHASGMALALIWGAVVFIINRPFFLWLTPILGSLLLAIPLSVYTSRAGLGRRLKKWGLLCIPEEIAPPEELEQVRQAESAERPSSSALAISRQEGFVRAVVDPGIHALHLGLLRGRRSVSPQIATRRQELKKKALAFGPDSLTAREKTQLLYDPARLAELHLEVWTLPEGPLSEMWGIAPARH